MKDPDKMSKNELRLEVYELRREKRAWETLQVVTIASVTAKVKALTRRLQKSTLPIT